MPSRPFVFALLSLIFTGASGCCMMDPCCDPMIEVPPGYAGCVDRCPVTPRGPCRQPFFKRRANRETQQFYSTYGMSDCGCEPCGSCGSCGGMMSGFPAGEMINDGMMFDNGMSGMMMPQTSSSGYCPHCQQQQMSQQMMMQPQPMMQQPMMSQPMMQPQQMMNQPTMQPQPMMQPQMAPQQAPPAAPPVSPSGEPMPTQAPMPTPDNSTSQFEYYAPNPGLQQPMMMPSQMMPSQMMPSQGVHQTLFVPGTPTY